MTADPHQQSALIKQKARELGFDLCGVCRAEPSARQDYYLNWIAAGQHGQMHYLADRAQERLDPRTFFPPAKSVVCVGMNYFVPDREGEAPAAPGVSRAQGSAGASPSLGRIARYANARDYHEHIKDRLYDLADFIRDSFPGALTKVGVDTVPVLERELAMKAGIGWQGKNSCIISPEIGSWIFLAEVLTSLELPVDQPQIDHCGTCTRCIDACPTGAITAPYQLDARKCISYLTIEHAGAIDSNLRDQMGDWLFGCDICQDVCPFNGRAPTALDPFLQPRFINGSLNPETVANWTLDEYHSATRRTAMRRVKLPQFQRNARIVLENAR